MSIDWDTIRSHPAAAAFPLMNDEQLDSLALDIKVHGQRVEVVLWDGGGEWLLLDGRNRLRACQSLGKVPKHVIYDGKDPIDFVLAANMHRRHLSTSQRALIAAEITKLYESGQKAPGKSRDKAGKALNVSGREVQRAKKVKEKSASVIMDAVRAGDVTVVDAESVVALPVEVQAELYEAVVGGDARTLREAAVLAGHIAEDPGKIAIDRVVRELRGLRLDQLRQLRTEIDALIEAQERGAA